jgi:hypothetical protein
MPPQPCMYLEAAERRREHKSMITRPLLGWTPPGRRTLALYSTFSRFRHHQPHLPAAVRVPYIPPIQTSECNLKIASDLKLRIAGTQSRASGSARMALGESLSFSLHILRGWVKLGGK